MVTQVFACKFQKFQYFRFNISIAFNNWIFPKKVIRPIRQNSFTFKHNYCYPIRQSYRNICRNEISFERTATYISAHRSKHYLLDVSYTIAFKCSLLLLSLLQLHIHSRGERKQYIYRFWNVFEQILWSNVILLSLFS